MVAIRSIDEIALKWSTVTPQRAEQYRKGIENPIGDWRTSTLAANDNWKVGVTEAVAADRFKTGVEAVDNNKWQTQTLLKGVSRWGVGVQLATDAYRKGFAPFRNALAALTLPPRFARRDPRNLDRVKAVVDVMIATAESVA